MICSSFKKNNMDKILICDIIQRCWGKKTLSCELIRTLKIAYFIVFAGFQASDMVKYKYQIGGAKDVLFHKPCTADDTG